MHFGQTPDGSAGVVVSTQGAPTGVNSFNWIRSDGIGIQVIAQPFHSLRGVTGDLYSGLWWIETPQADLDQWQLWQYDPSLERVVLRLRASGDLFQTGVPIVTTSLAPELISAQPEFQVETGAVSGVTLAARHGRHSSAEAISGRFSDHGADRRRRRR